MPNVLPFRKGFLTLRDPVNVEMNRQTGRLVVPRGWGGCLLMVVRLGVTKFF